MKTHILLSVITILVAILASTSNAQSQCDDEAYNFANPVECSEPPVILDCSDEGYAFANPVECFPSIADCSNEDYAFANPVECSEPVMLDCDDEFYAFMNPEECSVPVILDCSDDGYAFANPVECGPVLMCTEEVWSCTDFDFSQCTSDNIKTRSCTLSEDISCSDPDAVTPDETAACFCQPGSVRSGPTAPAGLPSNICHRRDTVITRCNDEGLWELVRCIEDDDDDDAPSSSGPSVSPPPPPPPANIAPVITDFSGVPTSVDAGSSLSVSITATDSDGGIDRIEILQSDGSTIISSQSCGNIVSCTRSFLVQVPNAVSTAYSFIARAFDNLGASVTSIRSGITNPGLPPTPPGPGPSPGPAPEPDEVLEDVLVNIRSKNLFVSTLIPDTGCVAPGAETFLYSSLRNRGSKTLKDVKITAIVPELGIRAVSGPFNIRKGQSVFRFLNFDVPEDAESDTYYIRISITSQKDSVVKYRTFEVNSAC